MKRNAQLVCQHLENISRQALEQYQDIIRQYVRGRQGVYALYRRGKLYYVGLATNLRNRLKHHLHDRHAGSWDRFSVYITIGDHHLRELEALILRTVKPAGNKQKGQFEKSEDLRRQFSRDMKANFAVAMNGMLYAAPPKRRKAPAKVDAGRKSTLAEYVKKPFQIRGEHKGKTYKARVRRDGLIRFNGKIYTAPSMPAAHACSLKACDGWTFWKYQRAPGDWVYLDELRK